MTGGLERHAATNLIASNPPFAGLSISSQRVTLGSNQMSLTRETTYHVARGAAAIDEHDATGPPSSAEHSRFYSLDAVRSGMMLLGIFYHASSLYYYIFGRGLVTKAFRDAQTSHALLYIDRGLHIFRMPVFFVVAGFFGALLYARRGSRGLIASRTRRVLVPLIVAWILLVPAISRGVLFAAAAGSPQPLAPVFRLVASGQFYERSLFHLWFLYHLMILYTMALAAVWVSRQTGQRLRVKARSLFRRIVQSPWRPLLLALPTVLILEAMPRGDITRDLAFTPDVRILFAYSLFFAFGWLLFASSDLLPGFARNAPRNVAAAVLLFPVFLAVYGRGPQGSLAHFLTSSTDALITWLCVFGLIGLAVQYLNRPHPTIRYVSDASYWCYLVHYPIVIWLAGALSVVQMAGVLKVLVNLLATSGILLITYRFWVRPTFIGEWLNGRRVPAHPPIDPNWQPASQV